MIVFRRLINKQLPKLCLHEQIRYAPRWSSRIPKKVHLPEQAYEDENKSIAPRGPVDSESKNLSYPTSYSFQKKTDTKILSNEKKFKNQGDLEILTLRKAKIKKQTISTDMLETIIDADGNLIYSKMDNNDSRVARVLSNLKSEKSSKVRESIMLEGKRLIKEALKSGCKLEYIFFSRKSDLEELQPDLPKLGAHIYKMPYREIQLWSDLTTNPGIMGVFKVPEIKQEVQYDIPVNVICDNVREPGNLGAILRVCAAVGCKEVILTKGCCDIWNTKVLRSAMGAHFKLRIQKLDWIEIEQNLNNSNWFIADNNIISISKQSSSIVDLVNKIPIESYDALKYTGSNQISLVIGGETEGISENAYSTVEALGGMRLHIPLGNNIESLNSGTALGVLIFEMRRQIKQNT